MVAIEYEAMHKLLQMPTDNALRKSYFGHYGNELPWNGVISWRQHKQTNIYNAKDNPPLHFGITHSKLSLGVKKLQTTFNAARSTVELRSYFLRPSRIQLDTKRKRFHYITCWRVGSTCLCKATDYLFLSWFTCVLVMSSLAVHFGDITNWTVLLERHSLVSYFNLTSVSIHPGIHHKARLHSSTRLNLLVRYNQQLF